MQLQSKIHFLAGKILMSIKQLLKILDGPMQLQNLELIVWWFMEWFVASIGN